MLNKSVILSASLLTVLTSVNVQANPTILTSQPITASAVVTKHSSGIAARANKPVYLMNIQLTPEQKAYFTNDLATTDINPNDFSKSKLPSKAELSMNGTPVLDQGQHGSCVTFATTAAIDALIGKGDYVSQLCNLELGAYLEKNGYNYSGWNGSFGNIVLNQIQAFGIISKDNQRAKSCGGLTEYPVENPDDVGQPMQLEEFATMSENFYVYSHPILTFLKRIELANQHFDGAKVLDKVKKAIAAPQDSSTGSYRVTFGTLLPVQYCSAGACGKYHQTNDSWVLTKEILKDKKPYLGGHEMVIVGYDDKAVATDNDGKKHQGLLILRNSWGEEVGDNGNYYMSYDFFTKFVLEANLVITVNLAKK